MVIWEGQKHIRATHPGIIRITRVLRGRSNNNPPRVGRVERLLLCIQGNNRGSNNNPPRVGRVERTMLAFYLACDRNNNPPRVGRVERLWQLQLYSDLPEP